jgi:CRP-like cAMP-binding protein
MVSYDSSVTILEPGDENIEFVYVVMSGYLGVFQNYYNDETDAQDYRRIDSMITGDVFGELYLIFDIPCQVLIKTEERSNIIRIPKAVFEEHIKEYYLENMEAMIDFYRQLFFGDKIQLKHLLPLASVTQMRKIQGNVIVVKQDDKSKYIFFVKSGQFKVMREVDFIKEIEPSKRSKAKNFYKDPCEDDISDDNIKTHLLEIEKLERFNSFGDRNFPPPKYIECYEPFTVISTVPSEVYFVDREVFLQLLPKMYSLDLKSFPDDFNLRKRFYEQRSWRKYKGKVFSKLLKSDKKRNPLTCNRADNKASKKQSPLKLPYLPNADYSVSKGQSLGASNMFK